MHDEDRGKIRNNEYAKQLFDFSGLRWEKITPTDIDGYVEFGGKLSIFIEIKLEGYSPSPGQRLALERLCDLNKVPACVLIANHKKPIDDQPIPAHPLPVQEYYWKGKWQATRKPMNIKQCIDELRKIIIPL
jgi:hypothetical protein